MNRRELISLVAGLVIGLLLGIAVLGSSEDLRDELFGTAGDDDQNAANAGRGDDELVYYHVKLSEAKDWLTDKYDADIFDSDELDTELSSIAKLATYDEVQKYVEENDSTVESVVLQQMYAALTNAEDPTAVKIEPDSPVSICLVFDDDPYNPTSNLFITVPAKLAKDSDVPEEWEPLSKRPMLLAPDSDLICFPGEDDKGAAPSDDVSDNTGDE
jgi:hypothetical protein